VNPQLVILIAALVIATGTDVARRKIYNWTTYPAIAACIAAGAWTAGLDGAGDAIFGLVVCGGLMLVCYLCLDVGGGDVKLAALIGAGLGWANGLYALLWTFTVAGVIAASIIIWRVGAAKLLTSVLRRIRSRPREDEQSVLHTEMRRPLFLAPAALVAVLIVTSPHWFTPAGPQSHGRVQRVDGIII
jgi:Flp pilus assembly protein protease CpaA